MADMLDRLEEMLGKKSAAVKTVAASKGQEGEPVDRGVLNKSITMIEQGGDVIEWK